MGTGLSKSAIRAEKVRNSVGSPVSSASRSARRMRGQSAVEFALVVPMLFVILFGIIDMSRILQAYEAVYHAAREGARYASTGRQEPNGGGGYLSREDSVKLQARNALAGLVLDASASDETQVGFYWVSISPSTGGGGGDFEEVEVRYSVFTLVPGVSKLAPHILLSAKQRVINEHFGAIPKLDRANIPPTPIPLPTFTPVPTPTFTPVPTFTATATPTATGTPPPVTPTVTGTPPTPTVTGTPPTPTPTRTVGP